MVLRPSFLLSCAETGEINNTDRNTEKTATNQSLVLEFAEVVLPAFRVLFSNFISKFVLYARNFYGLTVHDPRLVFEFHGSVKRCAMKQT